MEGQLGYGDYENHKNIVDIKIPGEVKAITAGSYNSMALSKKGSLFLGSQCRCYCRQ